MATSNQIKPTSSHADEPRSAASKDRGETAHENVSPNRSSAMMTSYKELYDANQSEAMMTSHKVITRKKMIPASDLRA